VASHGSVGVDAVRDVVATHAPDRRVESVRLLGEGLDHVVFEVDGDLVVRFARQPDAARLHREVAARIEQQGRFWFATTEMKGRTWFRICPVNFRTRPEHIDDLFATLTEECARSLEGGVRSVRTPRRSGDSPGSPPTRTDRTRND